MAGEILEKLLLSMGASPARYGLEALKAGWTEIMGGEIASLGRPLGAKGEILLVGVEDSMAMQELRFMSADILARANAFLKTESFRELRLNLAPPGKVSDRKRR